MEDKELNLIVNKMADKLIENIIRDENFADKILEFANNLLDLAHKIKKINPNINRSNYDS